MDRCINTKSDQIIGDHYFFDHVMPEDFQYKLYKKQTVERFEPFGFKVSRMYKEYYAQVNGIESDEYLSMDVYLYYIIPALNRYDLKNAYLDKNIYTELFPNANQPETVVKNINGRFYIGKDEVDRNDAMTAVLAEMSDMIIKPTVETCNGDGVNIIKDKSDVGINNLFNTYKLNYIVQKKVRQHKELDRLNKTSLNTMRIFTYRRPNRGGIIHLQTFLRYGGEGTIKDNASVGGGFMLVKESGLVDDRVNYFKSLKTDSLYELKGLKDFVIPNYQAAIDFTLELHKGLPYFDLIGWDVAINENGFPMFIEYNLEPSIEAPQLAGGPLFGEYFDEVLRIASDVRKEKGWYIKHTFNRDSQYFFHIK